MVDYTYSQNKRLEMPFQCVLGALQIELRVGSKQPTNRIAENDYPLNLAYNAICKYMTYILQGKIIDLIKGQ